MVYFAMSVRSGPPPSDHTYFEGDVKKCLGLIWIITKKNKDVLNARFVMKFVQNVILYIIVQSFKKLHKWAILNCYDSIIHIKKNYGRTFRRQVIKFS